MLNVYKLMMFISLLTLSGCQLLTEPAPLLAIPTPPKLQSNSYDVFYRANPTELQIQSVQLPARPLLKGQIITLINPTLAKDSELFATLKKLFSDLGLVLQLDKSIDSDYRLTITKLEFVEGDKIDYRLEKDASLPFVVQQKFTQLNPQSCSSIKGTVGIRLTNTKTGNVVWFATAAADNTTLGHTELTYKVDWAQIITNKKEVKKFVDEQNSEQARLVRATVPVEPPKYIVAETASTPRFISGYCAVNNEKNISQQLQTFLLTELINKLNVI